MVADSCSLGLGRTTQWNLSWAQAVNAGGTITIQVDANGDGVFESTLTGTTAELTSLL